MAATITDVLNTWNDLGVFSYVIPFLLIFAVVFAILKKTKILGDDNDGILAIISVALGLLALQFDMVSEFYAIIFPRFGVWLSIFLVAIIFIGFFMPNRKDDEGLVYKWIGFVAAAAAILWSLDSWGQWTQFGFGSWFNENFWAIVIVGVVLATVIGVTKSKDTSGKSRGKSV